MSYKHHLAIIGAGRVGSAIAFLASKKAYEIIGLCCDRMEYSESAAAFLNQNELAKESPGPWLHDADLILITTPDDVIGSVCAEIARREYINPGSVVAHCSGVHPSSILKPAEDIGCFIGSVHPLQSCATKDLAVKILPGSFFGVEGSEEAKRVLKDLVIAIGGRILEIATSDKPIYHAGAAVASNFLVGLINFALSLYESIGIDRREGIQALTPLFDGTIGNIKDVGIPDALTGPIMRGDLGTVETHLRAIKRQVPSYIPLYCALGFETLRVAISKGVIDDKKERRFQELFEKYSHFPLN